MTTSKSLSYLSTRIQNKITSTQLNQLWLWSKMSCLFLFSKNLSFPLPISLSLCTFLSLLHTSNNHMISYCHTLARWYALRFTHAHTHTHTHTFNHTHTHTHSHSHTHTHAHAHAHALTHTHTHTHIFPVLVAGRGFTLKLF